MRADQSSVKQQVALGVNAWDGEDYEEALRIFREVLDEHPTFPDIHNKAGLCHAMLGDPDAALREFDTALELAPAYAEAHLNRGIVLNELGRHEEARAAFDEASRLDTRDGTDFPSNLGHQIAITHAHLGDLYRAANRSDRAAEQYRWALAVRPRFLDIRGKLAEALVETGEIEEARRELETVLEGNPDFTPVRIRLGVVLQRLGDTDGAIREWRRCAREAPTDIRPRAYLASVGAEGDEAVDGGAGDGEDDAGA